MDILKRKDFGVTDIPDLVTEIKQLRNALENIIQITFDGPMNDDNLDNIFRVCDQILIERESGK